MNISLKYKKGLVNGWGGPILAAQAWNLLRGESYIFDGLPIMTSPYRGKRMMLFDVTRKVLGKDTLNYPQEIGDCVSFGAKNATEYLQCCEILMKGDREKFRPVFPPYLYGTGRVFIGRGQLDGEDGSLGSWMADAVIKYGVLASDESNVPQYEGRVAKKWGDTPGPPDEFVNIGKTHPIKSAARINNWEELVTAICNGYPCTVASNQGFEMEAGNDGFHDASGQWGHQMCIVGVDDEYSQPYAIIVNSWGDAHGRLKDFNTNEELPIGVLRAKKNIIQRMINSGEVFAYSNFLGFPTQAIDKELFKLI